MKKAVIGVVVVLIVAGAAILIVPSVINWNTYKPRLIAMAEDATGRRLAVDGDLGLTILPSPALSMVDVRLSNAPGGSADSMIALERLEVEIALWPLLRREIRVRTVRLIKPVVDLEILADGTPNWIFQAPNDDGPGTEGGADTPGDETGALAGVSLEKFEIEDGTLVFRNASTGTEERIERLSAELSAAALASGPYVAKGSLTVRGLPLEFDLSVGDLAAPGSIPVSAEFVVERAGVAAVFAGQISAPSPDARFRGSFELSGEDLRAAGAVVADILGVDAPLQIPGAQDFSINAAVEGDINDLAFNEIELRLGETRATGAISAALRDPVSVDATIAFGRIDLDAWLEAGARPSPESNGAANGGTDPGDADIRLALPVLPGDIAASLNVTVEALSYRGDVVRQAEVSARLTGGTLDVSRAYALLPGGTAISAAGTLRVAEERPQFDGSVEVVSDDLRAFLAWLEVDLEEVPDDRLHNLSLQSQIRLTPDLAQVFSIDLRLDSTRLTGGAAYAFRTRPSFSVDLDLDRLNVDAYVDAKPASNVPANTVEITVPIDIVTTKVSIPVFDSFDANIKLAIGSLTAGGVVLNGLTIDGTLLGGEMEMRDVRIADLSGAAIGLTGTATGFAENIQITANVTVDADDPAGLLRQTGLTLPGPGGVWNPLQVTGRIAGNIEAFDVDLEAVAGKTQAGISGGIEWRGRDPRIDLSFGIANSSLFGLARALGGEIVPAPCGADGPVSLTGTARGELSNLTLDVAAAAAAAEISLAGSLEARDVPTFNFVLEATHQDLLGLLATLGVDYRPAVDNFGGFRLAADIAGTPARLQLSAAEGQVGLVGFAGNAVIELDGPRPHIVANLNTSEILVDLLLPRAEPATGGSGGAVRAPATPAGPNDRWSRDRIDLSILRTFDADLDLASRAISYGTYRFVDPNLVVRLEGGVLDVDPLSGTLFGGGVSLTMRVEAGEAVRLSARARLDGADIERALIESARIDRVSGRFDLDTSLATAGRSQFDMISALDGTLSFAARDGMIRGIDLRHLSDRLGELDGVGGFLGLIQSSLGGGETAYTSFSGTFDIQDGLARTDDLSARLDAAQGSGRGLIDLPSWHMDLRTQARLVEHPDAPPVGLDLIGPLDAPRREFRTEELEGYVAARVGRTILREILPRSRQQDDESNGGLQPLNPRNIIRGILRGGN